MCVKFLRSPFSRKRVIILGKACFWHRGFLTVLSVPVGVLAVTEGGGDRFYFSRSRAGVSINPDDTFQRTCIVVACVLFDVRPRKCKHILLLRCERWTNKAVQA